MLGMPALVIWGIGATLEADVDYLVKFGLFALLYIAVNGISMLTFDERLMNFLPLGIYMSTNAWIYYTWFAYVTLVVSPLATVAFVFSSTGLWYNFLKAWRADPGIVRTSQEVIIIDWKTDYHPYSGEVSHNHRVGRVRWLQPSCVLQVSIFFHVLEYVRAIILYIPLPRLYSPHSG